MTFYWDIIVTKRYLKSVSKYPITTQERIGKRWLQVARSGDPMSIGLTSPCGQKEDPSVVVVFPGLDFEFIYRVYEKAKAILLINCREIDLSDYGQVDDEYYE